MAYLVVNSRYNPFSYDELVKPLVDYTNEYNRQEELANALSERAASLGDLSPDIDKEAYDSYNNWREELGAASEQLSANGLSPETRQRIRQLNSQYSTTLSPLVDKMKTRNELVKEQRALQAKNPNIFFDTDYSTASLSDISSASTYNVYDPDSIAKAVGEDVYSRMSNGEAVPSMDEYLARYGAGLNDETKLARVNQAINSGVALGSSTYKQKDFENYIKEITAKRTRSTGSTGSSGVGGGSQVAQAVNVDLPNGGMVPVTYDKKSGEYTFKDKDGKPQAISVDEADTAAVLRKYYGGDYTSINIGGMRIPWVDTPNGVMIQVKTSGQNQWVGLKQGNTATVRDVLRVLNGGKDVSLPTDSELESTNDRRINKKIDDGTYKPEEANPYDINAAENPTLAVLCNKLKALAEAGLISDFGLTVYKEGNTIKAFKCKPEYTVDFKAKANPNWD